jgi:hypothetical protein
MPVCSRGVLVERGVRFVQIFHEAWDHHGGLTAGLKEQCAKTDRASAALVKDLKQRGLLDDTLVIWGGEFGRTPMVQGGKRWARSPSELFHDVDGWWRREAWAHPRESDDFGFKRCRIASTSTTSTPQFCTCSDSITPS